MEIRYRYLCCAIAIIIAYLIQSDSNPSLLDTYDYIIVGGGSAGCVLAARLSELPVTVLLIEAGGEFGIVSKIPIMPTMLQNGPYDWAFRTVPQKHSSHGLADNVQFVPRGKGLGGSGQINYLLHALGKPSDFAEWSKYNISGWDYDSLRPIVDSVFGDGEFKDDFQIRLTKTDPVLADITETFLKAARKIGREAESFAYTIYNGIRESSYSKYIKRRNNLHILQNTIAGKILFDDNVARSVQIIRPDNSTEIISAKNEIIVSCGSIKSPQLLMLSGIGPESNLRKLGIETIVDNDRVGQNLHDHLNMPIYVKIKEPYSMTLNKITSIKSIVDYLMYGRGYLSSPAVTAFANAGNHSAVIMFAMGSTDEQLLREISNYKSDTYRALFPSYNDPSQEGLILLSTCLQPSSRGNIVLKDSNPMSSPIIDPDYLSEQSDVHCMINALKLVIEMIQTQPFIDIGAEIHWPNILQCNETEINDRYLECITRSAALTAHHFGGTCSMGSVVDDQLRVRGVRNLRVIDASVLPTPISSPPNSIVIAIAERIARSIKDQF